MKLIVLYGPPASGKYTLAKAITEHTGYKLFHNHLTIDLLQTVFNFGSPGFFKLSSKIRLDIFELAAKENIPGLVFTFVYAKNDDDEFIRDLIDRVTAHGGEVVFIQVYCEQHKLLERVTNESRKEFRKLASRENLIKSLDAYDQISPIDFVSSIKVDNTNLTVEEATQRILAVL